MEKTVSNIKRVAYTLAALAFFTVLIALAQVTPSVFTGCNVRTTSTLPTFTNLQTTALNCNDRGALRVDVTGFSSQATPVNNSGTITTGGTFQTAIAANTGRRNCIIQNPVTASGPLYVFLGTAGSGTVNTSLSLNPGGTFNCSGNSVTVAVEIAVMHATTGAVFIAYSI